MSTLSNGFNSPPSLASAEASSSSSASSEFGDVWSRPSSSVSPASSIGSSPSFVPKDPFLPVLEGLSLDGPPAPAPKPPTATQVSAYAASIIRNEAYALLALAARLAPAAQPVVPEADESSERLSTSSVEDETSSESSTQPESRTNAAFTHVVDLLSSLPAHGKIIVTGIGKSGIAARKMVATFNSLGVPAAYLHPVEALHGDLGAVCPCTPSYPCDALLLCSHSGATAELMRLLPIVRPRVRHVIAVTRDPDSVLARACGGWLDSGTGAYVGPSKDGHKYTDEADSTLPAPTSSVVCALAVGDALGLTLSRLRLGWEKDGKVRRADFFRCHPGGQLGIELGREGRGIEPASNASAQH